MSNKYIRNTPEYHSYFHAKNRCEKNTDKRFKDYGGRGIKFKFNSYEEFYDCLGRKPSQGYSLDRIDNNGHYEPGNVRWANSKEQAMNRRTTLINMELEKLIIHKFINGMTGYKIAKELKLKSQTVYGMLHQRNLL